MKFLLLGRDGQVGRALGDLLPQYGETVALGRAEVNFEHPDQLTETIDREHPDVVVNAAAYTAVDAAEDNEDRAFGINARAVGAIGRAARKNGALVVHYSTDCVFDGAVGCYQLETQATNPVSVYGASKLEGERLLGASGADHLLLRVSWIYAERGRNFPLAVLRLAKERKELTMVADEFGAPTPASLVALASLEAIRQTVSDRSKSGLYHLAAAGSVSRHELALYIVEAALDAGASLALDMDKIRAITAEEHGARAKRPANSRLDTTKFRATFNAHLPPWQDGIRQLIKTLRARGDI
ncbi:MAG: dTDP-4-dehydrorhamnose reductase [Devosia sp.]